jgi:hypothetical protein
VKVILQTSDLLIELDGKEFVISSKDGAISIYSEDGVKVIDESKIGRWVTLK